MESLIKTKRFRTLLKQPWPSLSLLRRKRRMKMKVSYKKKPNSTSSILKTVILILMLHNQRLQPWGDIRLEHHRMMRWWRLITRKTITNKVKKLLLLVILLMESAVIKQELLLALSVRKSRLKSLIYKSLLMQLKVQWQLVSHDCWNNTLSRL